MATKSGRDSQYPCLLWVKQRSLLRTAVASVIAGRRLCVSAKHYQDVKPNCRDQSFCCLAKEYGVYLRQEVGVGEL